MGRAEARTCRATRLPSTCEPIDRDSTRSMIPRADEILIYGLQILYHGSVIDTTKGRGTVSQDGNGRGAGGVQSIERAFDLLEMLADAGGALGLSELASTSGLPLPTVHRLMRTLVNRGYVRQEASRRYTLGSRLIRLGDTSSRMLGTWLRPCLAQLVRKTK